MLSVSISGEKTLIKHSTLNIGFFSIQVMFNGLILNAQLLEYVDSDLSRSQLTRVRLIGIDQHIFNMDRIFLFGI